MARAFYNIMFIQKGYYAKGEIMGFFKPKMKITSEKKREIEALLARTRTCARHINETDIIKNYFAEWDKIENNCHTLLEYEKKGFPFKPKMAETYKQMKNMQKDSEKEFIDRAYERMLRSAAQVTTDKAKKNKAFSFFSELEFYYPRLSPESVEYAEALKKRTEYEMPKTTQIKSKDETLNAICPSCGAVIMQGNVFCGKCGHRME